MVCKELSSWGKPAWTGILLSCLLWYRTSYYCPAPTTTDSHGGHPLSWSHSSKQASQHRFTLHLLQHHQICFMRTPCSSPRRFLCRERVGFLLKMGGFSISIFMYFDVSRRIFDVFLLAPVLSYLHVFRCILPYLNVFSGYTEIH